MQDALNWAKKMQVEYGACRGKKGVKTGGDVENCMHASLAKQGIATATAGSTSPSGKVTIASSAMTQCQPILDHGTEIHEAVHARTQAALAKQFGKGTPAFDKAWDSADSWITDEVNAYGVEIPFYQGVLAALKTLEGKL